jgi:hypothetical protein
LEETTSLNAPVSWAPVNVPAPHVNGFHCVTLPLQGPMRFFRLKSGGRLVQ